MIADSTVPELLARTGAPDVERAFLSLIDGAAAEEAEGPPVGADEAGTRAVRATAGTPGEERP